MFKFGFNFNLTPCFFLEISFNSCLICTARPAFYGVNGQSSTKICFKYNVFDIIHCVFFCGSVDQKITGKEGSTSSSFAWFVFFFPFFSVAVVSFCLFCFVFFVQFLSLRLFFLYSHCSPLLYLNFKRFCDTRIFRYYVRSAMTRYGYIW